MAYILFFIAITFFFIIAAFGVFIIFQTLLGIPPYMPSFGRDLEEGLKAAGVRPGVEFVDIGSGDGKLVFLAARLGAHATGVEINPLLIFVCRARAFITRNKNVRFVRGSFYEHDLSSYDVIYTYLFPETMEKLESKIFSEMKSDAKVITNTFTFKDRKPSKSIDKLHIYSKKN